MEQNITRWELLTLLLAIKTLVEENKGEKALYLMDEVISEIKRTADLLESCPCGGFLFCLGQRQLIKCKSKNANPKMQIQKCK